MLLNIFPYHEAPNHNCDLQWSLLKSSVGAGGDVGDVVALDDDLLGHRLLNVRVLHDDVVKEGELLLLLVDVEEPLLPFVLDLE